MRQFPSEIRQSIMRKIMKFSFGYFIQRKVFNYVPVTVFPHM